MQKWDQTRVIWDLSHGRPPIVVHDRKTNIPIPERGYTFACTALWAESQLGGDILFTIGFCDCGERYERRCPPSPYGEEFILNHLIQAGVPSINVIEPSAVVPLSRMFTLLYPRRGECCEQMLLLADGLFELLGIEDQTKELLMNFRIERNTFVKQGGEWVTYLDYLRKRYRRADGLFSKTGQIIIR